MASFYRSEYYCPTCKNTARTKTCKLCGNKNTSGRGTWGVRFRTVENGVRINKNLSGFETKMQAELEFSKIQSSSNLNSGVADNVLFEELFSLFLEHSQRTRKESSYYDLEKTSIRNILPKFKNRKINDISKIDILNFQNELTAKNFSYRYKTKIRSYLYQFYRFANNYYNIPNVVAGVEPFYKEKKKKELKIWTVEQFNLFIDAVDRIEFKMLFLTIFYLGLRLGEALALSPDDINFKTNKIKINKSLTKKTSKAPYLITTPKNLESNRELEMPEILRNAMLDYYNNIDKTETFLFGGAKPLANTTVYTVFNKAIKDAKLTKIRIHDFRHSHASILINLGADIVLVAHRLGHSDIKMTLNTYSHLMPKAESELIRKLNLALK